MVEILCVFVTSMRATQNQVASRSESSAEGGRYLRGCHASNAEHHRMWRLPQMADVLRCPALQRLDIENEESVHRFASVYDRGYRVVMTEMMPPRETWRLLQTQCMHNPVSNYYNGVHQI